MNRILRFIYFAILLLSSNQLFSQNPALESEFKNPPDAAWPRTWWHWTGGNVTKDGITKDLEWMKQAGIGGFQLADVAFGTGQTVENKLMFGTPEWLDAVHHAAAEAERLGLEMAIFSSAGWSLTGGPWVKPEQAMKKLVWSETRIKGPKNFSGQLVQPPSNNGPFRNMGRSNSDPTLYKDCAVIAYRMPVSAENMAELNSKITTHDSLIDAAALLDDDLNSTLKIKSPENGSPAWVQFEFEKPFTARAFTISGPRGVPVGRLLASEDGKTFRTLVNLPGAQLYRQGWVRTFAIPETHAKYFRIEMTGAPLNPDATMNQPPSKPAKEYILAEAILHAEPRVHRWEEKAGNRLLFEYESVPTPQIPATQAISQENIINLTEKMDSAGNLKWKVPAGNWTILRMGYSLTGGKNRPAVPSGLGFEVDKLSRKHTEAYLRGYTEPLAKELGSLYGKTLRYVLMDSWEAGMQNWTDDMLSEFRQRRGYDPQPYLPVLAGRVVESAEVSDRFLWDFRRTLADMFAENHYAVISEFLQKQGIGTYGEASGVSLEIMEDALLCKKFMDIPMGEFWTRALHPWQMYYEDVRSAASAAHVYGKKIVAAEAFTGGGYESPATLKQIADYWFAQGINQLVFHTSAHQPLDSKPGNTMVGTHIHRNITWAEQAKPLMTHFARTSYLLQQGQSVADLAYLLNEGGPSTMPIWGAGLQPSVPEGYDFDYINRDVLLYRMSVNENGDLVLPDGTCYRVLVLPQTDRMTLPVLQKIHELVHAGAVIVGPRPVKTPDLAGFPDSDIELQKLAAEIWGDLDGVSRNKSTFGKGRVIWGLPLDEVLDGLEISNDVEYSQPLDMKLAWLHRRTSDADIYFLASQSGEAHDIEVRFRVQGKAPELWFADTGNIQPAAFTCENGLTTVPIHFPPHGSVFVVFRQETEEKTLSLPKVNRKILASVDGAWDVSFPPNLGAPEKIQMEKLQSWTQSGVEGVKYFSGTATYRKTFNASKSWFKNDAKLLLALGEVNDLAEVIVNGKTVEIAWKPPFEIDVTAALKKGKNQLEIKVTNGWTNRIIGDHAGPTDKNVLPGSSAIRFFGPPPPLVESGLLGPVRVILVD